MSELTEFLLARVAEDEAVARAVRIARDRSESIPAWTITVGAFGWSPSGVFASRITSARILAEGEAKRRIVAVYNDGFATRLHAAVYADHPDYRPEWLP